MTNAPADLLGLRSRIQARTGLSAVNDGIVGDTAHAATGGYHEGKTDLQRAGVLGTDYSVRLQRDKNGLTESASAMDIGDDWPTGGRAAWLRFNGLLVAALHANDPALSAVRATNYSPDGTRKLRTDREAGWSTVGTSDVVDIHTHIEWYRDTEGKRAASLDRIDALIAQAINPTAVPAPKKGETMAVVLNVLAADGKNFGGVTDGGGGWHYLPDMPAATEAQAAFGPGRTVSADLARRAYGITLDSNGYPVAPPAAPVTMTVADQQAIIAGFVAALPADLAAQVAAAVTGKEAAAAQAAADALKS